MVLLFFILKTNCIKVFFQEWSSAIQAISVIILVLITFWYARRTHQMATIMQREYQLKIRPYLMLENVIDRFFDNLLNPTQLQLQFHFQNVCLIAIGYRVEQVLLNNIDITATPANLFLFPQQTVLYTTLFYNPQAVIPNNGDGLDGVIRIQLWNAEMPERRYFFLRRFRLTPNIRMITLNEQFELIG